MMYRFISNKISNFFAENQIIKEEEKDIYTYGLELLVSLILTTLLIILISIPLGSFFDTLLYLIGFFAVRTICGGFHANRHSICFLITIGTYSIFLLLSYLIQKANIVLPADIVISIISTIIILLFAPIEHPNNPMTEYRKKKNRQLSVILCVLTIAFDVISFIFTQWAVYLFQLHLGTFLAAIAVFAAEIEIILKRKEKVKP